jgi:hypothetical protein
MFKSIKYQKNVKLTNIFNNENINLANFMAMQLVTGISPQSPGKSMWDLW